jgi:hypothetical protein
MIQIKKYKTRPKLYKKCNRIMENIVNKFKIEILIIMEIIDLWLIKKKELLVFNSNSNNINRVGARIN